MDQGKLIQKESIDSGNLFETSDKEVQDMSQEEFQEHFYVQEEFVDQECPEQEIITHSWDMNHPLDIDNILETEVKCMSSTCDVDILIPEVEEASFSVNPYPSDFCSQRFNQKSKFMTQMIAHKLERLFCCPVCGVYFQRECDLDDHKNIHVAPSVLNSDLYGQNGSVTKVMNKSMDPIHRRSIIPGDDSKNKRDTYRVPNTKNRGNGKVLPKKYHLTTLGGNSEHKSIPHKCNLCGILFTSEKALLNHASLHHLNKGVNIVTTRKTNSNSFQLTILANTNSDDVTSYICDLCGAVFNRFNFLKLHTRQHMKKEIGNIEEEAYKCIHCELFFKCIQELEAHTKQHLIPTNIPERSKCIACGEKFDSTDEQSDHFSQIHTDLLPPYSCKICGKSYKDDKDLKKHSMVHDTLENNCIICDKRFNSRTRLKRHMISHQNKSVVCNVCGEEVADNRALISHKACHSNTVTVSEYSRIKKIFPCTKCDKVFSSTTSQQIHLRIHTGERPFNCRHCDKAFADGGTLRKHVRIHTGEKPYACPVCPKAFNQRVVMHKHIRIRHAETAANGFKLTYKCKVCDYLLQSSKELWSHLVQHSDENTKQSKVVSTKPRKYNQHSKLGSKKHTWYYVEKLCAAKSEQLDTESYTDEPMPFTEEELAVKSTMHQDDIPFNLNMPMPVVSHPKSSIKSNKIVNGKLVKNVKKLSKQVVYGNFAVPKSVPIPKKASFVLKKGECTRTCSTVSYYYPKSNLTVMDSSFGAEFKENDNSEDPGDQIFKEDIDTNLNTEPNFEQPEFTVEDYNDICNIYFYHLGEVEDYFHNNKTGVYVENNELENCCKTEPDLMFDKDYIKEVGANVELSTEEIEPVLEESISCDICDEIFENIKEVIKHIKKMHI